jgi:hypothetical protein
MIAAVGAAAAFEGAFVRVDSEIDFATDDPNNHEGDGGHHE